jgi:hypothetical protein
MKFYSQNLIIRMGAGEKWDPNTLKEYTLRDGTDVKITYPFKVWITVEHSKTSVSPGHFSFSYQHVKG